MPVIVKWWSWCRGFWAIYQIFKCLDLYLPKKSWKKNWSNLKLIWDPLNFLQKIWDPLFFSPKISGDGVWKIFQNLKGSKNITNSVRNNALSSIILIEKGASMRTEKFKIVINLSKEKNVVEKCLKLAPRRKNYGPLIKEVHIFLWDNPLSINQTNFYGAISKNIQTFLLLILDVSIHWSICKMLCLFFHYVIN